MNAPLVTGLGCVSAIGDTAPQFWQALLSGASGIREVTSFSHDGLRTPLAGEIRLSPRMRALADESGIKSRLLLFAALAIDEAIADAGVDIAAVLDGGHKVGLVLGTSLGMSLVAPEMVGESLTELEGDAANAQLGALAEALERRYHLAGEVTVVSTACASATHAIALALDMIRHGGYHTVIAGGADNLDRMKYLGHSALSTLSTGLPRPFSRHRDGTLFGEGAGILVLQDAGVGQTSLRYATCRGAGYSTDIQHVTAPDPQGVGGAMAIRAALADGDLRPEDIGHVNLHGSGTALNDSAEYGALAAVFGERLRRLPCTSIKAAVGHAMGAAGGLEAVAAVLTLRDAQAPPTLNVTPDDVEFPLDLVVDRPRRLDRVGCVLSNSFGFGGANGVLVFGH